MAIPYQFYEGNFENMKNITLKAGNILICKDTRQVYIDLNLSDGAGTEVPTRICLGSIDIDKSDGTKENIPLTDYVKSLLSDMENSDGTLKSVATFISERLGNLGKKDDGTDKSVKEYIDDEAVKKSGDTMTGRLNISTGTYPNIQLETKNACSQFIKLVNENGDSGTMILDVDSSGEESSINICANASLEDTAIIQYKGENYNILHTGNKNLIALEDLNGITITTTEVNYLDNVTSNIQTQIDGKAPTSHASTATTYGVSSASEYGHAMASSTTPKANGTAEVGSETAKFARGDHVHPAQTTITGNAGTATKLETARKIQIKLNSTSAASFDGSSNITPGVTGTLPIANGGTGKTTAAEALTALGGVKKSGDTMTDALSIETTTGGSISSIYPGNSQTIIHNKINGTSQQELRIGEDGLQYYKNSTPYQIYGQHNVTVAAESDDKTVAGTTALATGHIHLVYE